LGRRRKLVLLLKMYGSLWPCKHTQSLLLLLLLDNRQDGSAQACLQLLLLKTAVVHLHLHRCSWCTDNPTCCHRCCCCHR
jgi:hypothetical protein